jgi:hypothetical protein
MIAIDPLNPSNNTTRTAFRIDDILAVFRNTNAFIEQQLMNF